MKRFLRRALAVSAATTLTLTFGGIAAFGAVPPPAATTGAITSVLPTTAVATGVVDPHGATTKWYFEYGASTTYGSTTPENTVSGSSAVTVSASLVGLSPATNYHYRLVASNSGGVTHGADGNFSTSQVPTAETGAASQLTASAATLNGVVNAEGQTTTWYFQYGTTTAYGSKTAAKSLVASPSDVKVSSSITTLAPQTTYHYRLVATSAAGVSHGIDVMFTTGLSVTLNTSASQVVYGGLDTVSGLVATGAAGDHVTLESERFDQTSFVGVAAMVTSAGGVWSYSVQPTARTTYKAIANGGTSSPVTVGVSPAVPIALLGGGRLTTHVVGGMSFADHVVQLQMLTHGRWIAIKLLHLNANAKSVFSDSLLPRGRTTIRIGIGSSIVGIDQAGPGYLAGFSRSIKYNRT